MTNLTPERPMTTKDDIITALVTACEDLAHTNELLADQLSNPCDGCDSYPCKETCSALKRYLELCKTDHESHNKAEAALALAKPDKAPAFGKLCETDKTNPIPLKVDVDTIGFKGLIKLACELNVPHDESQWLDDEWPDKVDELRVAVAEAMERRTK